MARDKRKDVAVRLDKGKYLLDFYFRDVRCREYIGVSEGKDGLRYANRQAMKLEGEILDGSFDYADWFPDSKMCSRFGFKASNLQRKFSDVADEWVEKELPRKVKLEGLKDNTNKGYKNIILRMKKYLGNHLINNITSDIIEDYMLSLSNEENLSNKTINNRLTPLRELFAYAKKNRYIRTNIMLEVKNMPVELPEIEPFSEYEVYLILDYLEKNEPELYAMFAVFFYAGLRVGEVLAMKWKNLNEVHSAYYVKEHFTLGKLTTPKTKSSKRVVPLPPECMAALKNHKQYTLLKSDYIFVTKHGEPFLSSKHIREKVWEHMLKVLGIPYRIIYQCRHTHATLSILAGDNYLDIAERMGHKNVTTLLTRYVKYIKTVQKRESKIGGFIAGAFKNQEAEHLSAVNPETYCQNTVRKQKSSDIK